MGEQRTRRGSVLSFRIRVENCKERPNVWCNYIRYYWRPINYISFKLRSNHLHGAMQDQKKWINWTFTHGVDPFQMILTPRCEYGAPSVSNSRCWRLAFRVCTFAMEFKCHSVAAPSPVLHSQNKGTSTPMFTMVLLQEVKLWKSVPAIIKRWIEKAWSNYMVGFIDLWRIRTLSYSQGMKGVWDHPPKWSKPDFEGPESHVYCYVYSLGSSVKNISEWERHKETHYFADVVYVL